MKRIIPIVLVLALALAGCAEAPENELVTQRNTDRLVEAATQSDENRQTAEETRQTLPENYTFQYDSEDERVHIAAAADVYMAPAGTIPMYSLSCTGFTQEQVTGIYNYLFQGEQTWAAGVYTREMCEQYILECREAIAEAESDPQWDEETRQEIIDSYNEVIRDMEAAYEELPSEAESPRVPADGTLQEKTVNILGSQETYLGLDIEDDDGDTLYVFNQPEGNPNGQPSLTYTKNSDYQYYVYEGVAVKESEADSLCTSTSKLAEAEELAQGLFDAAGVEVQLVQVALQKGVKKSMIAVVEEREEDYSTYQLTYARVIDGIPVAVTTSNYVYHDDTAPIWLYEQINVLVSSDGIVSVDWSFPVSLEETISNDVEILSFRDAAAIFEQMAPLIYSGKVTDDDAGTNNDHSYDVTVDRVELNLMRVKDNGSELTGLYVPAWVFYGTETRHIYYNDFDSTLDSVEQTPWIILAVNAIDGSTIDVVNGY